MIDLTYKSYTDKMYIIDEVHKIIKIDKKQLNKLNIDALLELLSFGEQNQDKDGLIKLLQSKGK